MTQKLFPILEARHFGDSVTLRPETRTLITNYTTIEGDEVIKLVGILPDKLELEVVVANDMIYFTNIGLANCNWQIETPGTHSAYFQTMERNSPFTLQLGRIYTIAFPCFTIAKPVLAQLIFDTTNPLVISVTFKLN